MIRRFTELFNTKPATLPVDGMFGDYIPDEKPGVLFGLDPPKGYYFDVSFNSVYEAWHVYIRENGREHGNVGSGLVFCRDRYPRNDEATIKAAAEKALRDYNSKQSVKNLEGHYPPKRTY